jgi:hypothetical protein
VSENTVTRSFRISETAFLALEEEAKKRNISINTLVNQLFLSFANFDRYFQKFGMTKISKVAYRKTLRSVPDNELTELARGSTEQREGSYPRQTRNGIPERNPRLASGSLRICTMVSVQ